MDHGIAKELSRHIDALQSRRRFGHNFEERTSESVALKLDPLGLGGQVVAVPGGPVARVCRVCLTSRSTYHRAKPARGRWIQTPNYTLECDEPLWARAAK